MNCQEFLESMFEFRRGEGKPGERALGRAHLASCGRCRQELAETEVCFSMMKSCCGAEKIPENLELKLKKLIASCCGSGK